MESEQKNIPAMYQQLVVIWIALFNSQILFFVLIYFSSIPFKIQPRGSFLGNTPVATIVFAVISVALVGASFIFRSIFYKRSVNEQKPEMVKTGLIIALALCEGTSLLGVLSAFIFRYEYSFAFISLAMAGMVFHFPLRSTLINATAARRIRTERTGLRTECR
ncbi:MAG TPA: hypothetical protein VMM38_04265 [Aridibacter sp.]|nr:hypothetical protein [Aridibacter sp.]